MKTNIILTATLLFMLGATSCNKKDCTSYDRFGNKMVEVKGEKICEDQISSEEGEYCICDN